MQQHSSRIYINLLLRKCIYIATRHGTLHTTALYEAINQTNSSTDTCSLHAVVKVEKK